MTDASCHEPGNSKPHCMMSDVLDRLQEDNKALKIGHHGTVKALSGVRAEVSAVRTETRLANQKLDRIVQGLEIGNIKPVRGPVVEIPTPAIQDEIPVVPIPDWDRDEPTLSGKEPEAAAAMWKVRAVVSQDQIGDLQAALATAQAELAAAQATIKATEAERNRNSERAEKLDNKRWTRAQKIGAGIGAFILALLTAIGGGGLGAKLLSK